MHMLVLWKEAEQNISLLNILRLADTLQGRYS